MATVFVDFIIGTGATGDADDAANWFAADHVTPLGRIGQAGDAVIEVGHLSNATALAGDSFSQSTNTDLISGTFNILPPATIFGTVNGGNGGTFAGMVTPSGGSVILVACNAATFAGGYDGLITPAMEATAEAAAAAAQLVTDTAAVDAVKSKLLAPASGGPASLLTKVGTATLPAAANVATGSGTFGVGGNGSTPSYPTTAATKSAMKTDIASAAPMYDGTTGAMTVPGTTDGPYALSTTIYVPKQGDVVSPAKTRNNLTGSATSGGGITRSSALSLGL